ncbi:MAG: GAF domain-containing protein, partial [Candidatus Eremiobacteraeota bacterium]|nr:GAF domain-containing protein [Candidatus Eremiobacteraeota bacterium]
MTPPAAIQRASIWLALSLLLVMIATLGLAPPAATLDSEALLFLGVAALLLENAAVFMPCFGVFSPAPAVYLAAAATPGLGPAVAIFLGLGGLLLRTVLVAPRRDCQWLEAWLELLPVALGILLMAVVGYAGLEAAWPRALIGGAVMALARQYWPRRLMSDRLARDQYLTWVGVLLTLQSLWLGPIFGGLTILALMQQSKWQMLWAMPLLWGVCKAADYAIFRVEALEAEASRKKLAESQSHLEEARTEASRAREKLQSAAEREALLEGFAQQLASDPTIEQVVKGALATIRALVPCREAAIYLARDGRLEPSGQAEPGVAQAFESGRVATPRTLSQPASGADTHWLAVPLGKEGVLYVGRDTRPFNKDEGSRLALVAEKATLAIGASRRSQARQQAFQESTAARYQLQERVELLALLMEGARELASSLEIPVLESSVKQLLERVVPHDVGALITHRGQFAWAEGNHPKPGPEVALATVVKRVLATGQPHLDADGAGLIPGMKSIIVVPLRTEQDITGALLLAAAPAHSFNTEHENLLSAIAYQAAVALANAGHFQDVVEARRQLEESQAQLIQSSKLTAVGQLAAGVSHELNNPLGAISVSIASAQTQLE